MLQRAMLNDSRNKRCTIQNIHRWEYEGGRLLNRYSTPMPNESMRSEQPSGVMNPSQAAHGRDRIADRGLPSELLRGVR